MNLDVAHRTDIGLIREENEDALFINPAQQLFIVADGMGGHNAGEVASQMACQVIPECLQENISLKDTLSTLVGACLEAHNRICSEASSQPELNGMGTTAEVLWIREDRAYFAHVGDSRIYLFREGRLRQLTEDQSLVNKYLREGLITRQDARYSLMRNVVLQALGGPEELKPETGEVLLEEDDVLLICTDGLTDLLEDEEIEEILHSESDLNSQANLLCDTALDRGGKDNITVVLIRVME